MKVLLVYFPGTEGMIYALGRSIIELDTVCLFELNRQTYRVRKYTVTCRSSYCCGAPKLSLNSPLKNCDALAHFMPKAQLRASCKAKHG